MTKEKAYITCSNGVYFISDELEFPERILKTPKRLGLFRKKGYSFFGIDFHKKSNRVIVASRERAGTKKHNKPTTDMFLYAIDIASNKTQKIAVIYDVHDVHPKIFNRVKFLMQCNRVLKKYVVDKYMFIITENLLN